MVKRTNLSKIKKVLKQIKKIGKPLVTIVVSPSIKSYSTSKDNRRFISSIAYYDRAVAGFPQAEDKESFWVIDNELKPGEQEVTLKELTDKEIKKLPESKKWFEERKLKVHQISDAFDIVEVFKIIDGNWVEIVNLWTTENCIKDPQLLLLDQSLIVPIFGFETRVLQPLNGHTIKMAGTSIGKSTIALVLGYVPLKNPTHPGLLGGNLENYSKQRKGELHGYGLCILDELNFEDSQIIGHLLTYLEQGIVEVMQKIPIFFSIIPFVFSFASFRNSSD